MQPKRARQRWTDDEIQQLRQLVDDGLSTPTIAERMGRSIHSVRTMRWHLPGILIVADLRRTEAL